MKKQLDKSAIAAEVGTSNPIQTTELDDPNAPQLMNFKLTRAEVTSVRVAAASFGIANNELFRRMFEAWQEKVGRRF